MAECAPAKRIQKSSYHRGVPEKMRQMAHFFCLDGRDSMKEKRDTGLPWPPLSVSVTQRKQNCGAPTQSNNFQRGLHTTSFSLLPHSDHSQYLSAKLVVSFSAVFKFENIWYLLEIQLWLSVLSSLDCP